VKLLLDEMLSNEIAIQLRLRGHDVVAITERPELRSMSDPEVLELAQLEGRVVATENAGDFRRIANEQLAQGHAHVGPILTSDRRFPRSDRRTIGRMVTALDVLLSAAMDLQISEYWLS
jgi:predicted nuclease of predicted toxin-antitoxin system